MCIRDRYKAFDAAGIAYEKTAVGDKYVNENMVKNGHALGGEQSGHIIFSKFATTGDGILTSLKIMEAMIEQKQSLAQLAEPVEIFPQTVSYTHLIFFLTHTNKTLFKPRHRVYVLLYRYL